MAWDCDNAAEPELSVICVSYIGIHLLKIMYIIHIQGIKDSHKLVR